MFKLLKNFPTTLVVCGTLCLSTIFLFQNCGQKNSAFKAAPNSQGSLGESPVQDVSIDAPPEEGRNVAVDPGVVVDPIDNRPPVGFVLVEFTESPDIISNENSGTFKFQATEGSQFIDSYKCQLDEGPQETCEENKSIPFYSLDLGQHSFRVFITLNNGKMALKQFNWLTLDREPEFFWAPWSSWHDTGSCDNGKIKQIRERACMVALPIDFDSAKHISKDSSFCEEKLGGKSVANKVRDCKDPINGGWGPFGAYGPYSSIDCGIRSRTRLCNKPTPQFGGAHCIGSSEHIDYLKCPDKPICEPATKAPCGNFPNGDGLKVCKSSGSGCGACSLDTCDSGYTKVGNKCVKDNTCKPSTKAPCGNFPNGDGLKVCKSSGSGYGACILDTCDSGYTKVGNKCVRKPINGGWTGFSYGPWTNKTLSCGSRTGTRSCTNPGPKYGGKTCSGSKSKTVKKTCSYICTPNSNTSCPIANGVGSKKCNSSGSSYGTCTLTKCNPGFKKVGNKCVRKAIDGGWTAFSYGPWSDKAYSCGVRVATRTCTNPSPKYGGKKCSGLSNTKAAKTCKERKTYGAYGAWTNVGKCVRGKRDQTATRKIKIFKGSQLVKEISDVKKRSVSCDYYVRVSNSTALYTTTSTPNMICYPGHKVVGCVSGENRVNGTNINYHYGTWGGVSGTGNYIWLRRNNHYCYKNGQKQDNDGTDKVVAFKCSPTANQNIPIRTYAPSTQEGDYGHPSSHGY